MVGKTYEDFRIGGRDRCFVVYKVDNQKQVPYYMCRKFGSKQSNLSTETLQSVSLMVAHFGGD